MEQKEEINKLKVEQQNLKDNLFAAEMRLQILERRYTKHCNTTNAHEV